MNESHTLLDWNNEWLLSKDEDPSSLRRVEIAIFIYRNVFLLIMVVKSNNCTFCKIINKEVDSYTLFENEKILAFLDIDPISKGHTLIIPKKHYKDISDTPKDTLTKIMLAAKKVSKDLLSIFNYDSV